MKNFKALVAAAAITAAMFGPSVASAADVSKPVAPVTQFGNSGFFADGFVSPAGSTFTEKFTFNVTGAPSRLSADVSSVGSDAWNGLALTGFSLHTSGGSLISTTNESKTGQFDYFTAKSGLLAVGSYYLQVTGSVLSNNGSTFTGNIALSAVPEPETYALMLGGLGLVGFAARRRKANQA